MQTRAESTNFKATLPTAPTGFYWECIDVEKNTVWIGLYSESTGACCAHQKIAVDFYGAAGVREAGVRLLGKVTS